MQRLSRKFKLRKAEPLAASKNVVCEIELFWARAEIDFMEENPYQPPRELSSSPLDRRRRRYLQAIQQAIWLTLWMGLVVIPLTMLLMSLAIPFSLFR